MHTTMRQRCAASCDCCLQGRSSFHSRSAGRFASAALLNDIATCTSLMQAVATLGKCEASNTSALLPAINQQGG